MADEAYRKAVDLLARRPHFEREIRFKLRDRGFVAEETETAIDRLRRIGYLDDDSCARDFARAKLRRTPMGRRRLAGELRRRGAPDDSIDLVLADPELQSDAHLARLAATKWAARGKRDRAALMRHLDRRGFSKSVILTVAEEQISLDDPSPQP